MSSDLPAGTLASTLGLSIHHRAIEELENEFGDAVWLIVDGAPLEPIDGERYVGQPPIELLANKGFTAPSAVATEVPLGRCTCGELGCGAVVARVYQLDYDWIVWDTFASGNPAPIDLAKPKPNSDAIFFDLNQYRAALRELNRSP